MKEKLGIVGLMVVSVVVIFWRMNEGFVWFTDELLFEEASYRMAAGESWLTPRLEDVEVWIEKPPLYFWMTAPLFWVQDKFVEVMPLNERVMPGGIFGFPWIRRFWTMVVGVGSVYVTYLIGKKMFGYGIGILAGILLLSTPLFLATTKAASLDMMAGLWISLGMYFYILNKETKKQRNNSQLITDKKQKTEELGDKKEISWLILSGIFMGLAVMTRSVLGLVGLLVMGIDQLWLSKVKLSWRDWVVMGSTAGAIFLPWHLYIFLKYPELFKDVYLGFNLVNHGINLTEGYAETGPWFYVWALLEGNAWLLPVVITAGVGWGFLRLGFVKRQQSKIPKSEVSTQILKQVFDREVLDSEARTRRAQTESVQDDNKKSIRFLLIWFLVPLTLLSLAATRHEWYLVQALPPFVILMALLTRWTYRVIACPNCAVVKYLSQIIFVTLVVGSILSVLSIENPSAESVKVLKWMAEQIGPEEVVYSYKRGYLPNTLLYKPRKVEVIKIEELRKLENDNEKSYMYVAEQDWEEVAGQIEHFEEVKSYKNGRVVVI